MPDLCCRCADFLPWSFVGLGVRALVDSESRVREKGASAVVGRTRSGRVTRRGIKLGGEAMPEASMKQKLAAGELVLCMNLRLARSVDIAMVAKAGGYDALYVDMQHAPYSIETTATICAAALGIGIAPLVRVPSHDALWMSRVLDGGAQGVILPDVNTSAQAQAIVRACRFPPLGKRSVMGLGPALGYRAVPLSELNPKLNAETAVIVML